MSKQRPLGLVCSKCGTQHAARLPCPKPPRDPAADLELALKTHADIGRDMQQSAEHMAQLLTELKAVLSEREEQVKKLEGRLQEAEQSLADVRETLKQRDREDDELLRVLVRNADKVLGPENVLTESVPAFEFRRALERLQKTVH